MEIMSLYLASIPMGHIRIITDTPNHFDAQWTMQMAIVWSFRPTQLIPNGFFSWFILLTAVKRGILRNGNEQTNEQKMCVSGHIAQERVLNACWPKQNIITE